MKNVKFVHMCFAGAVMACMAIIAASLGHTSISGALQDILTVLSTLALTVVIANFKWRKP